MAERGEVVVCVPVFGALEAVRRCLASVERHTAPEVGVIVGDDATPGAGVDELLPSERFELVRRERNLGFVENANALLRAAAPADVVLLNSDCIVGPGWLDGLLAAAATDTRIATVSALANEGTIVSVPEGERADPDAAAEAVRSGALGLRPRLPTAIGHCFLIRRSALELVGDLDPAFSPGYGEEVDFSQRCLVRGLIHVVADEVYVHHGGGASFGDPGGLRTAHERLLNERWPHYAGAVWRTMNAAPGPLADARGAARRALRRKLSVTIDGSALGRSVMGTQVVTVALARALAERDELNVRVALPAGAGDQARAALAGIDTVALTDVERGVERSDVVHRPSQVAAAKNLDWLHRLGERIVITQLDLIAYANPSYFESFERWDELRSATRGSLAIADAAVFISQSGRADALAEELVDPERAHVVPPGVDHASAAAAPVEGIERPFLACIGADFRHKNRVFAIRLRRELARNGLDTTLVLAGPHVEHGSSLEDEEAEGLDGVVRLGEVSEAEKRWLYENAALVLYPTVSEGFGLVPFEAAAAGTPCMYAPVSSLPEVAGAENATLVPWSVAESAERALTLLRDDAAARRLVDALAERGRAYTWDRAAEALAEIYRDVVRRPAQPARGVYFGDALSDTALSLVGPGGQLPADVQKALLAIAARPALRGPVFALLRAPYRVLSRARRRR